MKKVSAFQYLLSKFGISLLFLGVSMTTYAAKIYELEPELYAIICEDGQIFSYQGSAGGLDIVVPELCEGHGGIAGNGGSGSAVGNATAGAAIASRRPATDISSRPTAADVSSRPAPAVATRGTLSFPSLTTVGGGEATTRGAAAPHNYDIDRIVEDGMRQLDKASPRLALAISERCDARSGARPIDVSQGSAMQCPLVENPSSGEIEPNRL